MKTIINFFISKRENKSESETGKERERERLSEKKKETSGPLHSWLTILPATRRNNYLFLFFFKQKKLLLQEDWFANNPSPCHYIYS